MKIEVVKERLQHMKRALDELKSMRKIERKDFLGDTRLQWSVERGFQIICEAVFDIGNHILVGKFSLAPSNYQSIIDELAKKGIITDELNKHFSGLGGFRNILVHDYMEIDAEEVYAKLKDRLGDFDMFIREVVGWLKEEG